MAKHSDVSGDSTGDRRSPRTFQQSSIDFNTLQKDLQKFTHWETNNGEGFFLLHFLFYLLLSYLHTDKNVYIKVRKKKSAIWRRKKVGLEVRKELANEIFP